MIYAIDFGTTNSLLAACDNNTLIDPIALDPEASDPTIMRSLLYFPNQDQCYYGKAALNQYLLHEMQGRFIRSFKKFLPSRSFIGTYIDQRPMNLEDLIGTFLKEMRDRANLHFNQDIDSVVLGRPALFSMNEADDRYAEGRLRKAAEIAGFKNISFCPEPIAAAREYKKKIEGEKILLVSDLGGGTSDFTVVKISPKEFETSDVLAVGGIPIAGDALDGAVMRKRVSKHFGAEVQYQVPFGKNILKMPKALMEQICSPAEISILRKRDTMDFFRQVQQWSLNEGDQKTIDQLFALIEDNLGFKIFDSIEEVKINLSSQDETRLQFQYPGIQIDEKFTLSQYDELIESQTKKILGTLDDTLKKAGVKPSDIDLVCSTGGTAYVRKIQKGLLDRFAPEQLFSHRHFHSVVSGLAEQARSVENG